jgi:NADPH2:quinone reductase
MEGYYKIIELDHYGGKLKLKERSFRNIQRFEILIKIMCTTIHPADLMFIKGQYGDLKPDIFPVTPGFEGSGEIIKVGEDIDRKYVGRKVAVFANSNHTGTFDGVWSEYHYTTLPSVMVFDKDIQYERICFLINPMSAVGIFDTIRKLKVGTFVQTAASSNIGKMLYKLCHRDGINVINLVKDYHSFNQLKDIFATNVIITSTPEWEKELEKLCFQFKVDTAFDCLGGEMTGKLISLLPNGSTLFHYGNLLEQDIGKVQSADLIFKDKTVCGWWMVRWMQSLSQDEMIYWWSFVQSEIKSYSTIFETDISKEFKLEDINKAIDFYKSHSSEGKVILKTPSYSIL